MSVDSNAQANTDARLTQLESSIGENQGQKLEAWVAQVATSHQQFGTQMQQVHQSLASQHDAVESLKSDLGKHVTATGLKMDEVSNEMKGEFQKAMSHLTALLKKKQKTDHHS